MPNNVVVKKTGATATACVLLRGGAELATKARSRPVPDFAVTSVRMQTPELSTNGHGISSPQA